MAERHIFYLHTDKADSLLPVSGFGLDLRNYLCGLFSTHGTLTFSPNISLSEVRKMRCFLCSDVCQLSILPNYIELPILRELIFKDLNTDGLGHVTASISHDYSQILWLDVTSSSEVRNIRLYLKNEQGKDLPLAACQLNSTLLTFPKDGARSSERE